MVGVDIRVDLEASILRRLDGLGRGRRQTAAHLAAGAAGEREALFHLRRQGYTIVARRWRTPKLPGDVDLIGWDGDWLCFVEVKTRTVRDVVDPAEAAVDDDKRRVVRRMARAYLRRFPRELRDGIPVRFDVVSVYLQPSGNEFELYRGAFGWE
ncbi:hypothetical protein GCM10011507_22380 [Edaphobacter acidisoli]|uniref:UPF0102 protein GCM10011507_22380 n=1 Tax=Edaphobacter acidisoli TaxID=2040573 RepID=A0A916W5V8_9BACT|nr:YraN family protein [Edaphobacter acidisoli]GGA70367.1 hypothetical protein GCM10011507_22380 [Edaphobacter acidisoli]